MPIVALPELKPSGAVSLVEYAAAALCETMNSRTKSFGRVAAGPSVFMWTVCGSMMTTSFTRRT